MPKGVRGFQKGGIPWNKGTVGVQKNTRKGKTNVEFYGVERAEELKKKYQKGQKGKHSGILNGMYGRKRSERVKNAVRKANKGRAAWNKNLTKETDVRVKKYADRLKIVKGNMNLWLDSEVVSKILAGRGKSPNHLERLFIKLTPDCVRFVGDGSWWRKLLNGKYKNPDFKVTGQNKVIELFGDYWHRNDSPQELIDLYNQIGIACLVFWEHELYDQSELVVNKVLNFIQ